MDKTLLIIIGLSISFLATSLGAFLVFFLKKEISNNLSCLINGFSAGIMISASVWGSIIGTLLGCLFLIFIDLIVKISTKKQNSLHLQNQKSKNLKTFVIAFTIHNIPEGMAIGFAFGNAYLYNSNDLFASALMIAIAISIQNIPEGLAVSLPVYKETKRKAKSFFIGTLSGIVEPIFAIFGFFLSGIAKIIIPWLLAFSAGTMLFVAVDDLIPSSKNKNQLKKSNLI